jgi:protein-S-isoprenylcysteine O-methyltransferase Ste14
VNRASTPAGEPRQPPRFRPPFIGLALVLFAWIVDVLVAPPRAILWPWAWLGVSGIALGLGLIAWAIALFRRIGTTHDVRERPTRLVLIGPYRYTRNPMYLGITLILLGIGFMVGTWPFLVLPPIGFILAMTLFVIPREERILERAFGEEYETFRRRVRRWL